MKILRIVANNFKLCVDNFTISFIPSANKTEEDKEFELSEIAENLYVFNTLAFIGKNASGKTTAVELLDLVYDIFSNFRIKHSNYIFEYWNKEINLDITFFHEGYLYRYLTSIKKSEKLLDNSIILFENQKLYKRAYKKTYAKDLFAFDKYVPVTNLAELPNDTSILYNLLKEIRIRGLYCPSNDIEYSHFANCFDIYKLIGKNTNILESVLKIFDEHIKNIEMINENKFIIYYTNNTKKELTSEDLYNVLSSGTSKGITLFTLVVHSLISGCDLIIDEIENHFHKTLVEYLINLYKDKSVNKNNASLIFTTHYCELLDLFNRSDNIYITKYEKNIMLENIYENYRFRPELSKSNKFYNNAFNTNVNYESLMNFKKKLMK